MLSLLSELCLVLRDSLIGLYRLSIGEKQVTVRNRVEIKASREIVWDVATMLTGRLEGSPAIEYRGEVLDEDARLYRQSARLGGAEWETTFRVIDEIEHASRTFEVVESSPMTFEGDAPLDADGTLVLEQDEFRFGSDADRMHRYGFDILNVDDDTVALEMFHEVEQPQIGELISLPMTMRLVQRRIKDRCQARAGTTGKDSHPLVRDMDVASERYGVDYDNLLICIAAAGLTLGCFGTVYGWSFALLLFAAIAVNDLGYRVARRLLGLGDNVVFSVPFARAVAMEVDTDGTAAQRAASGLFASLFSAMPTGLLFFAFCVTGQGSFGVAATIFALFNLAYLLPIMPLDGARMWCAVGETLGQQRATPPWMGRRVGSRGCRACTRQRSDGDWSGAGIVATCFVGQPV